MAKAKAKAKPAVKKVAPKVVAEKMYLCLSPCFFRGKLYKPNRHSGPFIKFPADVVIPKDKHTGKPCFVEIRIGNVPDKDRPKGAYIRPRGEIPVSEKQGKRGKIGYGVPIKPQFPTPQ